VSGAGARYAIAGVPAPLQVSGAVSLKDFSFAGFGRGGYRPRSVHSSCGFLVAGQDLDSMLQLSMTQLLVHFSSGDHMTFVFSPRPQPTVRACYSRL